jgi:formiminotetrahydrofolate cyclodeaminase
MESWTIGTYLERLSATRPPTPAGGVVAALTVAQGAALLAMVAEIVGTPAGDVRDRAVRLQERALAVGAADVRAFDEVMAAAGMPRETVEERERRSAALTAALVAAAGPPADVVGLGEQVVELAERLVVVAGDTVVADVAAAAEAAAAGIGISRTNVESNLRGADGPEAARLRAVVASADGVLDRAGALRVQVRHRFRTG